MGLRRQRIGSFRCSFGMFQIGLVNKNMNMDVLDASDALSAFTDGSLEAGEFLLALSGDKERHVEVAVPTGFNAIRSVLVIHLDEEKLLEIATGIIANLLLFDDINDVCVERMNVPDFLYECCTRIDDPSTICEIFRALSNLVYVKKSEYLHTSVPTLSSLVIYLAGNSLSPKLLTQVVQLVYYIQIYSSPGMLQDWNQYWDAGSFFLPILGASIDESGGVSVSVPADEELYSTLSLMQSERIADCSGVEWLLLSIDRLTVCSDPKTSANAQLVCCSEHVLAFVVHLLLSSSLQSWEATAHKSAQKSLGAVLTPSASEKFLALSILENIVSFRTDCTDKSAVISSVSAVAGLYSVGKQEGFVTLLCTILETLEEALLMKDRYGVLSALYLVVQLYNHDVSIAGTAVTAAEGCAFFSLPLLVAHMSTVFALLQNVVELLALEDNLTWILDAGDQGSAVGTLKDFLNTIDDNLCVHSDCTAVPPVVPKKHLLAVRDVIRGIMPSLL